MPENPELTILIHGVDSLYFNGLSFLFEDVFKYDDKRLVFLQELTEINVTDADIVVLKLSPGEYGTCLPELQKRKKGLVFGLTDKPPDRRLANPSCYQDVILINRNAAPVEIQNIIRKAWRKYAEQEDKAIKHSCFYCRHKTLSAQQARILALIYKGIPVAEIADALAITGKTVLAHKYMTMKKFELENDYELINFLQRLADRNIQSNYFKNFLNSL